MIKDLAKAERILNEFRDKNELGNQMRVKFYKMLYKRFGYNNSSNIMSSMHIGSPYWKCANNVLRRLAGA